MTAARDLLLLAQDALAADRCTLWRPAHAGSELSVVAGAPDPAEPRAVPAGTGVLGAVLRHGAEVRLCGTDGALRNDRAVPGAGALLAVPLRAGGEIGGVLVAERDEARAFTDRELRVLVRLGAELTRAEAIDRRLAVAEAREREREVFYGAVERLNRLTTPEEVQAALLADALRVAPAEAAAVTLAEARGPGEPPAHRVVCAHGALAGADGLAWKDNTGLVASAVRFGAALPVHGRAAPGGLVLDTPERLEGMASLKVLPLRAGEEVLGTLVMGAHAPHAYPGDVARQLEVLALQAGDALLRARLFASVERLATTDGLTGLANRRVFSETLDHLTVQARRYGRSFSLLLGDVDHFKAVNDTHGHPAGDAVLRGLAAVLLNEARAADVAARYGGEELALLLPETGRAGALQTAERIRRRVAESAFHTASASLRVTLSIGVATFPEDGATKDALVAAADAGLYAAKRQGRNRVVAAGSAAPPGADPG